MSWRRLTPYAIEGRINAITIREEIVEPKKLSLPPEIT
jgi:hypothetical protein